MLIFRPILAGNLAWPLRGHKRVSGLRTQQKDGQLSGPLLRNTYLQISLKIFKTEPTPF